MKLILILSDVWERVIQLLFEFQIIFGKSTNKKEKTNTARLVKFLKNIFLVLQSNNIKIINESKKYIAAYFDKKPSPKKIPNIRKFIINGDFMALNKKSKLRDQKKIRITSVDSKKDETVTTGIK